MVLYRFMDNLCARGFEVVAVTPNERVYWHPSRSSEVIEQFTPPMPVRRAGLWSGAKSMIKRLPGVATLAARRSSGIRRPGSLSPGKEVERVTKGLIEQWILSDFTIATFCTTAYAAYALSDRTIPLYHMQHYEELFFDTDEWRRMARLSYFLPIELMANSSWLQGRIRQWIGRESQLLLPGIDTGVFNLRGSVSDKYAPGGKLIIVSYYSPARFKAWSDAVACMRLVYERLGQDAVEWKVFGPVPETPPELPVTFVGLCFGSALAQLYAGAHVAMMTSWYESFPLPPLEAMACGTAVVTTGAGTEDYLQPGVNALAVPARQPEALAEAIISLSRDRGLAARLAQAGVETASRFPWSTAADRLVEILHRSRSSMLWTRSKDLNHFLCES